MSELAKNCGLAVSSMARVVDRLVAKGCTRRIVSGSGTGLPKFATLGSHRSIRTRIYEQFGSLAFMAWALL